MGICQEIACVASVSVLFPRKDRAKNGASKWGGGGGGVGFPSFPSPSPLFHFLALVSFLAQPKPRISFLGLSLLRNSTETLATQASQEMAILIVLLFLVGFHYVSIRIYTSLAIFSS